MTFGQGISIVHSLVEHITNKISYGRTPNDHYRKPCHKDVVFTSNQNHKATCNEVYKSGEPLHSDGDIQHNHAEGRLKSS
jgi:hypothetical protein